MSEINRGLIIVKPKKPLHEWLISVSDDQEGLEDLAALQTDSTAYLVPEFGDDEEQQDILQEFYSYIFENELESWALDESTWPRERDLTMFLEWFEVDFHSMVEDLAEGMPIQDLKDGDDSDDYD